MLSTVDIPSFVYREQSTRCRSVVVDVAARHCQPQVTARGLGHTSTGGGFGEMLPSDARRDLVVLAALFIGMFLGSLIW